MAKVLGGQLLRRVGSTMHRNNLSLFKKKADKHEKQERD
jgi:hypothetical protein